MKQKELSIKIVGQTGFSTEAY